MPHDIQSIPFCGLCCENLIPFLNAFNTRLNRHFFGVPWTSEVEGKIEAMLARLKEQMALETGIPFQDVSVPFIFYNIEGRLDFDWSGIIERIHEHAS